MGLSRTKINQGLTVLKLCSAQRRTPCQPQADSCPFCLLWTLELSSSQHF